MSFRLKPLGWLLVAFILLAAIVLPIWYVDSLRERAEMHLYDLTHDNPVVTSRSQVRSVFSEFKQIRYADIPKEFRNRTGMNQREIRGRLKKLKFYAVQKKDLYRRIAGNDRLIKLVSADNRFRTATLFSEQEFYFALDTKVIYLLLDIRKQMQESDLDPDEIHIISGYRTPDHNERVGGKSESRHQLGDAIDLMIGDVNRDQRKDREDKKAVVPVFNRVVGSKGGFGKYARSLHIDTRGYRARW